MHLLQRLSYNIIIVGLSSPLDSHLLKSRACIIHGRLSSKCEINQCTHEWMLLKLFKYLWWPGLNMISKKVGEEKAIKHLRQRQAWEVCTNRTHFQKPLTSKVLGKWNNKRRADYSRKHSTDSHIQVGPTCVHLSTGSVSKLSPMCRRSAQPVLYANSTDSRAVVLNCGYKSEWPMELQKSWGQGPGMCLKVLQVSTLYSHSWEPLL